MKVCICGYEGSGKDTVATMLVESYQFKQFAFADNLKKAICIIFGWEEALLKGITVESRIWREQVDPYWEKELNRPGLTPRKVMQWIGTDVLREHFDDGIWIKSLKKQLITAKTNVVISDCRFPNEIDMVKNLGGIVIRVNRKDPEWMSLYNQVQDTTILYEKYGIHPCETALINYDKYDYIIDNNGTLEELQEKIQLLMNDLII